MLEMEDASLLLRGTDQGLYQLSSDRKSVSCPYKEIIYSIFSSGL